MAQINIKSYPNLTKPIQHKPTTKQYTLGQGNRSKIFLFLLLEASVMIQMSFTHSRRHVQLFQPNLHGLLIDLIVHNGFATQNLIRKPFLMVTRVKTPNIGWWVFSFKFQTHHENWAFLFLQPSEIVFLSNSRWQNL